MFTSHCDDVRAATAIIKSGKANPKIINRQPQPMQPFPAD